MLYERLYGQPDLTPLQERMCFIVHFHRRRVRFAELEVVALAGMNEQNKEALDKALDHYRDLLAPGAEESRDTFVEMAKKQLAEATKNVYLITPRQGLQRAGALRKAITSSNASVRSWAQQELRQEDQARERLARKVLRRRPLPKGTETWN